MEPRDWLSNIKLSSLETYFPATPTGLNRLYSHIICLYVYITTTIKEEEDMSMGGEVIERVGEGGGNYVIVHI